MPTPPSLVARAAAYLIREVEKPVCRCVHHSLRCRNQHGVMVVEGGTRLLAMTSHRVQEAGDQRSMILPPSHVKMACRPPTRNATPCLAVAPGTHTSHHHHFIVRPHGLPISPAARLPRRS